MPHEINLADPSTLKISLPLIGERLWVRMREQRSHQTAAGLWVDR